VKVAELDAGQLWKDRNLSLPMIASEIGNKKPLPMFE
jgi:hypothetical protein